MKPSSASARARGDELRHLVEPGEVARLASGRLHADDAGQGEGDVADGHQSAAVLLFVFTRHESFVLAAATADER